MNQDQYEPSKDLVFVASSLVCFEKTERKRCRKWPNCSLRTHESCINVGWGWLSGFTAVSIFICSTFLYVDIFPLTTKSIRFLCSLFAFHTNKRNECCCQSKLFKQKPFNASCCFDGCVNERERKGSTVAFTFISDDRILFLHRVRDHELTHPTRICQSSSFESIQSENKTGKIWLTIDDFAEKESRCVTFS